MKIYIVVFVRQYVLRLYKTLIYQLCTLLKIAEFFAENIILSVCIPHRMCSFYTENQYRYIYVIYVLCIYNISWLWTDISFSHTVYTCHYIYIYVRASRLWCIIFISSPDRSFPWRCYTFFLLTFSFVMLLYITNQ
jgi:hypothetical protein